MEEGGLRCDANVSLRPTGSAEFGTRTEIKNLNSFRNVHRAIDYEIKRQEACLEDGESVVQETRLFDAVRQTTQAMRSKEDAHDYRYFPNPDLPPVVVPRSALAEWRKTLPELPAPRIRRFVEQYGLTPEDAASLVADKAAAEYFEAAAKIGGQPRRLVGLMQSEFLRECSAAGIRPFEAKMTPDMLAGLAVIIDRGSISPRIAHEIFPELFARGIDPERFVAERGIAQISDSGELEKAVDAVLRENSTKVEEYKNGKTKLMAFFVGQIMRRTGGKANPALVNELLAQKLS
jgi:aspartyl-tRNA(Asn)/glutamyl-tRNA(Gln) amidotransferase subunit B